MSDKTLGEILGLVKSGQVPEYEDLYYGFLVLSHLHSFGWQDMLKVYKESPDETFGLKRLADDSFTRSKRAMVRRVAR